MDRQQLNVSQLLARRWSHRHPYSSELVKQAYDVACRENWWISSSMHISFTRLDAMQETVMDKWLQQITRSGKPRNLLLTFNLHSKNKDDMVWEEGYSVWLMRPWAKMTYQLIFPQKPKEISTKLIAYWLIMAMRFDCLHMCDLSL